MWMIYTIEEIKNKSVPIFKRYGVKSLSLFGSYARNEADENSDLDFCIEKGELKGLFQYYSLINELEDSFQCHVDLITTGVGDKEFLKQIREDEVILYG